MTEEQIDDAKARLEKFLSRRPQVDASAYVALTVGHRAVLHGCRIGDGCLIGMNSTVLDGAEIGARSIVAAGAVVPPRMKVPAGSMVVGCPAKIKKALSEEEQAALRLWAEKYLVVSAAHKAKFGGQTF